MLKSLENRSNKNEYPYNVINFDKIDLDAPIIFFTGENGSGKTTLLRAISYLTNSIQVSKNINYQLSKYSEYKIAWSTKLKKGYHFQGEDFYSFLTWVDKEEKENQLMYEESVKKHGNSNSIGKIMEKGLYKSNTRMMSDMVNEFKNASRGEGYIRFFASKLRPQALYLLDEPETPLSFQNQLTLLSLIDQYVKEGSQFIICTHSPILLAYPGAVIYHFSDTIESINYAEHPVVKDYQSFLNAPERYMNHLFGKK
ncbi:conserved hypothetical protein, ATP-binding domain [Alteracholeplasma palmae J233]|uniref:AAA+ ATPase domain-containing protein n=2 Tax=Acholeplasma palmae TaxID=38986 RepID=U4KRR7_ALTPJ|nr:conserved hypothetical protein, ATP-binding domain [Alteracholeplasma palmae J233]